MADTISNADSKRLPWRARADLQSTPLDFGGRPAWGIKDPINLAYFEMSDEAFFVLNQLDGKTASDDICHSFYERFRPRTLAVEELHGFVGQLVAQNLVMAETSGYGRTLAQKQKSFLDRQNWMALSNVLAIRFRGFDPDRLFTGMLKWVGWLFTPIAFSIGLILIFSAIVLVLVQFEELFARLPEARALLNASNLLWLSLSLAAVKVLHEFGHGLTCKRFGGECHELGVMLLVFTPTLYCNVSDIWMLKDKWKRMAVGMAGIWVEAIIAATCTLLWWFSVPGVFQSLCLNLVFVCGVSTLIFNGNPLMRYDGYFVLSDWLEIPNLHQQANAIVKNGLSEFFLGFGGGVGTDLSYRWKCGLFGYGFAASVYRVMLSLLILWGLDRWLTPFGLRMVVQLFALLTLGSLFVMPLITAARFVKSPANRTKINWSRLLWRGGLTLMSLLLIFCIPLPCYVISGALAEDEEARRVYATISGTLVEAAKVGQHVEAGQVVARLDEPKLKVSLTQLEGELEQQRARLDQLEKRRISEPELAQSIPTVRETVHDLEQQLLQRKRDAERLTLRAPRAGIILSATQQRRFTMSGSLATWSGSPLDMQNRGSYLKGGTTVCLIGSDHSRSALLVVNQDDINLVRAGQHVRLLWNELSGEVQQGEIVEIAGIDIGSLSREAVIRLNLPARVSAGGIIRPVGTWYQARVKLDENNQAIPHGSAGIAQILVNPMSLGTRMLRWIERTFSI